MFTTIEKLRIQRNKESCKNIPEQLPRFYIQKLNLNNSSRKGSIEKTIQTQLQQYVSPEIAAFFLSNQPEQLPVEPENLPVH